MHRGWRARAPAGRSGSSTQREFTNFSARARALDITSAAFAKAGADPLDSLRTVAGLLATALRGGCVVRLFVAWQARLEPVALAHADPAGLAWLHELHRKCPTAFTDAPSARVLQTCAPILMQVVSPKLMRVWTDPSYWPFLDERAVSSLLVVPVRRRGTLLGSLGLWREQPSTPFDEDDLVLTQEVADRAALQLRREHMFDTRYWKRALH